MKEHRELLLDILDSVFSQQGEEFSCQLLRESIINDEFICDLLVSHSAYGQVGEFRVRVNSFGECKIADDEDNWSDVTRESIFMRMCYQSWEILDEAMHYMGRRRSMTTHGIH